LRVDRSFAKIEHKENKSRVRSSPGDREKSSCWEGCDVGTKVPGSS
jgi:hypothetical protein